MRKLHEVEFVEPCGIALAKDVRQRLAVVAMWAVAMAACWLWLERPIIALAVETLAYALAMLWGYRTLKGVSGDVAGFALTISECAALMVLANLR